MRNSNSRRGTRLVPGMCVLLYSPASRTSIYAQVAWVSSRCFRSAGVIGCAMTFLQHYGATYANRWPQHTLGLLADQLPKCPTESSALLAPREENAIPCTCAL